MSNEAPDNSDELILTDAEIHGPLWIRIEQHLVARLARLRARNDNALTLEETNYTRGEIRAVKNLLAAGADRD